MRRLVAILFLLPALVSAVICANAPRVSRVQSGSAEVIDMTGRHVALPNNPRRAVIYPPELAAYLTIDGGAAHIAGASRVSRKAIEGAALGSIYSLAAIPTVSQGVGPGDLEALLLTEPDSALVWSNDVSVLESLGLRGVVGLSFDPTDLSRRIWTLVGSMIGDTNRISALLSRWAARRSELRELLLPPPMNIQTVAVLYRGAGVGQIGARYAHLNTGISFIGARNPADDRTITANSDLEQLFLLDPDMILLTPDYDRSPNDLYQDPTWQPLRAIRERRIYIAPRLADINGPIDDPLFILWLAKLCVAGASLPDWRQTFAATYREIYGVAPSEPTTDWVLNWKANMGSRHYERFAPSGSDPVTPAHHRE